MDVRAEARTYPTESFPQLVPPLSLAKQSFSAACAAATCMDARIECMLFLVRHLESGLDLT
jgi:hypothetical protein